MRPEIFFSQDRGYPEGGHHESQHEFQTNPENILPQQEDSGVLDIVGQDQSFQTIPYREPQIKTKNVEAMEKVVGEGNIGSTLYSYYWGTRMSPAEIADTLQIPGITKRDISNLISVCGIERHSRSQAREIDWKNLNASEREARLRSFGEFRATDAFPLQMEKARAVHVENLEIERNDFNTRFPSHIFADMVKSGMSLNAIASKTGRSPKYIGKLLKELKIEFPKRPQHKVKVDARRTSVLEALADREKVSSLSVTEYIILVLRYGTSEYLTSEGVAEALPAGHHVYGDNYSHPILGYSIYRTYSESSKYGKLSHSMVRQLESTAFKKLGLEKK